MASHLQALNAALEGRYVLEREIGRGGAATVYLALDRKHDRRVAVKVLHPELAQAGYHPDRFLREIRIIAGLSHPQILPLHDSGDADGTLYYVMPYVEGETLRERIDREGHLGLVDVVRIAREVAGALDYAHRQDVIHRDIKPENILFNDGQAVLADFGVALAIKAGFENLTGAGFAVGTPAYMSPEQAAADRVLDGRSDQYSLACVVYECLTGQPPFGGGPAQRTLARHALEDPRPIRSVRPDVPPGAQAAVRKALAKDPDERFDSTGQFAGALEAAGGTADGLGARGGREPPRSIAVLPFANVSPDPENEYFSDGMTDELINALSKVGGLRVASRTSVFALKRERDDVRVVGELLGVAAVLEGSVRKAGDRLRITAQLSGVEDGQLLWSERYDRRMDDVFAVQDEIARTIVNALRAGLVDLAGDPLPRRYTANVKAYGLYLKGRYFWNMRRQDHIATAIDYFNQAIAEDPEYALAYTGLADSYALQIDYRGLPVAQGMDRAKEEARKALALDESLAEAHTSLAWVTFIYDWDWDEAETHFRRAIALNPRYPTAHQWYAWLLMARGRVGEALAEGRLAVLLDPGSPTIRRSAGWLAYYARDYDAAVEHLERAQALDPTSAETQRILGLALMGRGSVDRAAAALAEAIAGDRSAYAVAADGYLAASRGEPGAARAALDRLAQRAAEEYVSPVAFVILHAALHQHDEAFEWLERAYEERRGWLAYLGIEPMLDPLREDPRFAELLRRMRLEEGSAA